MLLKSIARGQSVSENKTQRFASRFKEAAALFYQYFNQKYQDSSLTRALPGQYEKRLNYAVHIFPVAFRWLTLAVAAGHIYYQENQLVLSRPYFLLLMAFLYTILKSLVFHRPGRINLAHTFMAADLVFSALLLTGTDGIRGPFVLYSLNPILYAAIFLSVRMGALVVLYTVTIMVVHMFFLSDIPASTMFSEMSYLGIYVTAAILSCILPQIINFSLRNQLVKSKISEERQRLSHELHDGAAQTLAGLCWRIQSVRRDLSRDGRDMPELESIEELALRALQDTRESLSMLRTSPVAGGFLAHLEESLERLRKGTGVAYTIKGAEGSLPLSPDAEVQLPTICQEALTNIRKHARAANIKVEIFTDKKWVTVSISDDGCGFDMTAFGGSPGVSGHGLAVMQERAASVGGMVDVNSAPGQGTRIQVRMPAASGGRWLW